MNCAFTLEDLSKYPKITEVSKKESVKNLL